MQRSYDLDDEQLRKVAELFLQHLVEKRPELKAALGNDQQKETFLDTMVDVLKNQKDSGLTNYDLADKDFMQNLTVALSSAFKLKSLSADPKNDPIAKIREFLEKKGLDPDNLDKKSLEKALSPEEMKFLKKELEKLFKEVLKDLENGKLISMKPTPGNKKPPEEELTDMLLANQNIFGLLTPGQTGGLAIIVQVANGTRDYPDLNPNSGYAQIDRINNPNDNLGGGDSQGFDALAKRNLLQFEGDQFANDFQSELRGNGLAAGGIRPAGPGQAIK